MIDISIVIVNYNVKDYVIPCIESIFQFQSKLSIELIVVDNNSQDGSVEIIQNKFPDINLIKNNKNIGFSKGINQGVQFANGKYLLILNPDTYLLNNILSILFEYMEMNQNIAVTGPLLMSEKNQIQQSYWKKPTLINTLLSISHLDFLNNFKNYKSDKLINPLEVESISGCAFFVKTSVFNSISGFDPNLFWMEDVDFCTRILKKDYKICLIPEAKIIHYKGKSSEKNWPITIYNQLMSKIKYFNKHYSKFNSNILIIFIFLISCIKSFFLIIMSALDVKYKRKLDGYISVIKQIIKSTFYD